MWPAKGSGSISLVCFFLLLSMFHSSHHKVQFGRHADYEHLLRGTSGLVPNITIFGNVIVSSDKQTLADIDSEKLSPDEYNKLKIKVMRNEHVKDLEQQLPFSLTRWPAVFTNHCPRYIGLTNYDIFNTLFNVRLFN